MKFGRSRLVAVLAGLVWPPFRWLVLPFKVGPYPIQRVTESGGPARKGPWLADWRQVCWVPVYESVHPTAQRLILAALRSEMLPLRYWGGSTPGRERRISPGLVFQLGGCGPLYVAGYCHLRRAERVFRVERVEIAAKKDLILCITE